MYAAFPYPLFTKEAFLRSAVVSSSVGREASLPIKVFVIDRDAYRELYTQLKYPGTE